ncbi:hypothetical protein [Actinomadura macrotermitis]|uniref:Uncharacterized protein n=1 Tax=Actinomadura macrotermitis TaxID=2585200 RepID=A0A7K0C4K0_9ACTN|nr:hypothetical protein [Actinomadura macrotermitis]MQY07744.1 hypothetical protein [Actinomadura macrotermitis]
MIDSLIRTFVPLIAGALLAQAAKYGLDLPEGTVTELVTVLSTAVYYALARLLERRLPKAGRLLLSLGLTRRSPVYRSPGGAA